MQVTLEIFQNKGAYVELQWRSIKSLRNVPVVHAYYASTVARSMLQVCQQYVCRAYAIYHTA